MRMLGPGLSIEVLCKTIKSWRRYFPLMGSLCFHERSGFVFVFVSMVRSDFGFWFFIGGFSDF